MKENLFFGPKPTGKEFYSFELCSSGIILQLHNIYCIDSLDYDKYYYKRIMQESINYNNYLITDDLIMKRATFRLRRSV